MRRNSRFLKCRSVRKLSKGFSPSRPKSPRVSASRSPHFPILPGKRNKGIPIGVSRQCRGNGGISNEAEGERRIEILVVSPGRTSQSKRRRGSEGVGSFERESQLASQRPSDSLEVSKSHLHAESASRMVFFRHFSRKFKFRLERYSPSAVWAANSIATSLFMHGGREFVGWQRDVRLFTE
jgi:hypothetical protein